MGKSSTNGPFSMAMLNNQRVIGINSQPCDIWMCLICGMPSVMAVIGRLMISGGLRIIRGFSHPVDDLEPLEHFSLSPIVGMMIQSDSYFSWGLKPPISHKMSDKPKCDFWQQNWRKI